MQLTESLPIRSRRWPVVVVSLLGSLFRVAVSQQFSALNGQLVPPDLANNHSTPVYLTIAMSKLLSVDTVDYKFELIMDVITSWDDPRTAKIWGSGRQVSFADLIAARAGLETCDTSQDTIDRELDDYNSGDFSTNYAGAISPACRAAIQNPLQDNCSRYCVPSVLPICCDAIWIPAIDIAEVVAYPQERFVRDVILPVSSNGPGGNDTAVVRQTRIHATFSSRMSFLKFPFDRHVLQVEFMAVGIQYHLVGSGLSRNQTLLLTKSGSMRSDELARWKVTDLKLTCSRSMPIGKNDFNIKGLNKNDPLTRILGKDGAGGLPGTSDTLENDTCLLHIHIQRLHLFYGWNLIFPMLSTVSMSFAVFFVDPMDIGVRLSTTTTLFLALTALQFVTNAELPTSSYLTAFHKLIILSYFVIISISLQNLVVHYVASYEERLMRLKSKKQHYRNRRRGEASFAGGGLPDLQADDSSPGHSLEHNKDLESCGPQPGKAKSEEACVERESVEREELTDRGSREGGKGLTAWILRRRRTSRLRRKSSLRLDPMWKSLRRGVSSIRVIKFHEHVTEGQGYRMAHTLDRACALIIPLTYWVGAVTIFAY